MSISPNAISNIEYEKFVLSSMLLDNGFIIPKIDIDYLFSLSEIANTTAYAEFYAQQLKEKSNLHQIQTTAENVKNFFVKEFFYENFDKLLAFIRPVVKFFDKSPVICIDYLQRLIPRDHKTADTRVLIDDSLYKLKDFFNDTKTPLLLSVLSIAPTITCPFLLNISKNHA